MTAAAGVTGAGIKRSLPRRPEGDFYATPTRCTEALLAADPPPLGRVWEPACGDGAVAKVLSRAGYAVWETDLHDRGCSIYHGPAWDFLKTRTTPAGTVSIVTNPPFNLADEFALHALSLGARYVALFQRLSWMEGARRHSALWGPKPPARVWVFSSRQTLWRGDDPNGRATGGALAFAWFVWDALAPAGPPRLGWLNTKNPALPDPASLL